MSKGKTAGKALTAKQARFVEEYLIDLNATQAAIRSGYSAKNADKIGSELLGKTRVAEAIRTEQAIVSERNAITVDSVVADLCEIRDRCLQRKPVMAFDRVDKCMRQVEDEDTGLGVWTFDAANATRAVENLGKHLGMFGDRLTITINDLQGVINQIIAVIGDEVSDEPTRARIAERIAAIKAK
jgi:phage terminase small subunit